MSKTKPTEREMTEILARAMGWKLGQDSWEIPIWNKPNGRFIRCSDWNPFADPEGLGPVHEIEKRLSVWQQQAYTSKIFDLLLLAEPDGYLKQPTHWLLRHASPAICAEALARVFEPGRFEAALPTPPPSNTQETVEI